MVEPITKISQILQKGNKKQIIDNLINELTNISTYCSKILGQGFFGKVYENVVGPYFGLVIDDIKFILPIVTKEANNLGPITITQINDDLLIYTNNGLSSEALILYMISKLWYQELSPNIVFMIGTGNCSNNNSNIVTNIVLERHGLFDPIKIDVSNYTHTRLLQQPKYKMSFLETLGELSDYLTINYDDSFSCVLPNNKKVYIPDLIDFLLISYLHTSYFLWSQIGLTLVDQHFNNVLIHWINDLSRVGKKSLKSLEYIYYNLGDKYIKIPTFGILLKIGDVGLCIMNPQKNVLVIGDVAFIDNLPQYIKYKNYYPTYMHMLMLIFYSFPLEIVQKTRIFKLITNTFPLNKYRIEEGFTEELSKKCPNSMEILKNNVFQDLHIKEIDQNLNSDSYFVVRI